AGNLIVAESGMNKIRVVSSAGIITTLAGNGIPGASGDGGPARDATLSGPTQLVFDPSGNLLFTDRNNGRIRRIAAGTPPPPPTTGCGAVVKVTTTLTADVGPCVGDGLIIGADNITLNLNGHTVSGSGPVDGSDAGIRMTNRKGVRLTGPAGSTVRGFSAGVAIIGGSGNRVSGLTVADNVGPLTDEAIFGDGIGVFFSANNTIIDNTITRNGIYDGIGILGVLSDDNKLLNNRISDTTDGGVATQAGTGNGIIVNAFFSTEFPRERSVFRNTVSGNTIETSDNSGVANISNVYGVVADNVIRGNGRNAAQFLARNGIGVQHLDRAQTDTHMTIQNNTIVDNHGGDGIHVGADENVLRANQVHGNDSGILVTAQGHGNQILNNDASNNAPDLFSRADLEDDNFTIVAFEGPVWDCDQNTWRGNIWGSGGY
ncbi:MAG: right-handed parallel beta-helix repeat-containing protein, partial [Actinobacteria bacterium]|nr:right-handed parallel beta-helix repeat-containing protein [Actinomycetota bacterium]